MKRRNLFPASSSLPLLSNDGEDVALCRANCRQLLDEHPDLDGLYGVYSYHTVVMADVVAERGLDPRPKIFGWDVLPEAIEHLKAGRVDMAVWIKEYYFGFYGASAVANLVRLGQQDALTLMGLDPVDLWKNRICPPAEVITPETVDDYIAWRLDRNLDSRQTRLDQ